MFLVLNRKVLQKDMLHIIVENVFSLRLKCCFKNLHIAVQQKEETYTTQLGKMPTAVARMLPSWCTVVVGAVATLALFLL